MKTLRVAAVAACVCVLALALAGCKPGVPSTFIQEDDMEDLLYDYHLADAMARAAKGDYNENIMAYRAAVLRKYGVSQAEFDTSMVYYMRHTDRLHAIYEHVAQRMQDDARELGSSSDDLAALTTTSATGDTADIWRGERSIALIPNQPYNVYSFAHTADSSFRRGDAFILSLQSDFIFQDGARDGVAALAVVYANDSVASRVVHISAAGPSTLTLDNPDSLAVKAVRGFFLLNKDNQANASATTLHLMALSRIRLFRCHPKPKAATAMQPGAAAGQPADTMPRPDGSVPLPPPGHTGAPQLRQPTR